MSAGSREHGLKYQQLVHGLNIAGNSSRAPLYTPKCCLPFYYRYGTYFRVLLSWFALQLIDQILNHGQMSSWIASLCPN